MTSPINPDYWGGADMDSAFPFFFHLDELEFDFNSASRIYRPFGTSADAEWFRFQYPEFNHWDVLDVERGGYRDHYRSGLYGNGWFRTDYLLVYEDRDDSLTVREFAADCDTRQHLVHYEPTPLRKWIKPTECDTSWLAHYLQSVATGVTHQNFSDVPSYFQGFTSTLDSLFRGDTPTDAPPELTASAVESVTAIQSEGTTFIESFRWALTNYQQFRDAPVFGHVTNLLGIAITLGFAPPEWSEHHLNSVKLWRLSSDQRFKDMPSIVDGLVMALNYFVEATIASWEQGNLLPFLYERTTSTTLDKLFEELNLLMPTVFNGEYYKKGGEWGNLMAKLEHVAAVYKNAVECAPPGSIHRKILHDRQTRINLWSWDLAIARKGGDLVKQPFAAVVWGAPGCGKSGVTLDMQKILSAVHNATYIPSMTAAIEASDAFHSQVTNSTRFVIYDDVANRPLAYDPSLAIASMLQVVNNKPFVAIKAELELKGRVIPDLLGAFGTTNNRGLHINSITTEPGSLRRRFYIIDIEVRPEYKNDMGGIDTNMFNAHPAWKYYNGMKLGDSQMFTINVGYEDDHLPVTRTLENGERIALERLNIVDFYKWMEILMKEHDVEQTAHVERTNARKFNKCGKCGFVMCQCEEIMKRDQAAMPVRVEEDEPSVEHQNALLNIIAPAITGAMKQGLEDAIHDRFSGLWFIGWLMRYVTPTSWMTAVATRELISFLSGADWAQWWYYVPDDIWDNWKPFFIRFAPVMKDVQLRRSIYWWRSVNLLGLVGLFITSICSFVWGFNQSRLWWIATFGLVVFGAGARIATLHVTAYSAICRRKDALRRMGEASREEWSPRMKRLYNLVQNLVGLITIGGLGYFCYDHMTRSAELETTNRVEVKPKRVPDKKISLDQSMEGKEKRPPPPDDDDAPRIDFQNFIEISDEEMRRRNDVRNVWEDKVATYRSHYRNPGQTHEQLCKKVEANLSTILCQVNGEWEFCSNLLWICTDICLVTTHDIPTSPQRWRLVDNENPSSGKNVTVTRDDFLVLKGCDMAIGHICGRSKASLLQYICTMPTSLVASFVHRSANGLADPRHKVKGTMTVNTENVPKIEWQWPQHVRTYKGACGGTYVSDAKEPGIVGVHFGCLTRDDSIGISYMPSREDIENAMKLFMKDKSILLPADSPDSWCPKINGTPAFVETVEPENSILEQARWVRERSVEHQGALYKGHRSVTAFYKSRCVDTIIAGEIKKLFNPPDYGPPRFGRSMWPKSVQHSLEPSPGVPRSDLSWAAADYLSAFERFPAYLRQHLRPLTRDETLNGIDGVRFIDSMNWSTSMGLNYPGGKKAWVSEFIDENGHIRKAFADEVWSEVDRATECFRAGKRVPWIFNAVPKDEPTPLTKDKVRLFLVAEIACTLLVRKYYTPVCRVLQMTTGISECAVGINSLSADWEDLQQHFEKFSRVFDGDFSKYDLRMPDQVSLAAYRILAELASFGDYSDDDLFIMGMMASELVRPLVNFNGDVALLDGMTPSGIPITVIINSLCNSLLQRCAYHNMFPRDSVGAFRLYVAHGNYGDDFINAVSWYRSSFNFISLQKYLERYDIKITPAEKQAEGKRFVSRDSLVFLQRKTVKLPELPYRVGQLKEASIIKPLLSVLKPKAGFQPDLAAAINIDGALREWVYYGEQIYEQRRSQMEKILENHNMRHLSMVVDQSYLQLLASLQDLEDVPPS